MRFMMMVKANAESEAGKMPPPELLDVMGKFNEEMVKAGILLAGEGLHATSKGARVRFERGKQPVATDGPFTETKELIAGFWIIQVPSKEDAIAWAIKCPVLHETDEESEIEIRQLFESADFGPEVAAQEDQLREQIAAYARN